jgi:hypothetical protein
MSRLAGMLAWACLALLAVPIELAAQTGERIVDYAIEVDVRRDGSLDVTETIAVRAEGNRIRRGIYRDFPTRYRDRHGNNVVVDLEVLGVTRDGFTEPWFTERRGNGIRINTGSDEFLPDFPAPYAYTLRYRTTRQLGFFAEHDELYWNAIGTGWEFRIDAASVEVRLPDPVPSGELALDAYTGPQGATGRNYTTEVAAPGVARWHLSAPLAPREGFTIVLSFPKGIVTEPSGAQRAGWLLKDNRGVLIAFAGLVLLLGYTIRRWHQVGRDPRPGVVIARYFPPEGRSPAELRFLRRRRYDTRCFTSDLLAAAVQGRLRVERERRMLRADRWRLEKIDTTNGVPDLPTVAELIARLFTGGRRSMELEKKNASQLQSARQAHGRALNRRLHGSHFKRNAGSVVFAAAIAASSGFVAFALSGGGGVPLIATTAVLMAIVVAVFGWLVQAPTPEGRKLLDEIEGLARYLGVAERDELAAMPGPDAPPPLDAGRYEALLPFAVALEVEDAWTKKFTLAAGAAAAAAATQGIGWYRGGGVNDLGSLAKAVGSGLSTSIASASTPPGSSSGAGGGGSSGGGGGGGGGGGR